MKTVIVGGVAGGATAAARLRRLDEQAEIIVLERTHYVSYANCGLPYYVGKTITDKNKLTLQTPEKFRERFNIDVRVRHEVTRILRDTKQVEIVDLDTHETYRESYDKLILSPGAHPVTPQLPGIESSRIFTLRTVEDTFAIYDFIEANAPRTATVIGGGFIGLETAENLVERGIEVTLLQRPVHVMPTLDDDMACLLQNELRKHGVKLMLKADVTGFADSESNITSHIKGLPDVTSDFVVLAIGVVPETKLAQEAGLELGLKNTIKVDDRMRTTDPDIYAIGDAIEVTNQVSEQPAHIALAGPANKQGRIAADNICGIPRRFTGSQGSSIMKGFDLTVATTGLNRRAATAAGFDFEEVVISPANHATYYPGAETMTMKALFERATGRILGAQIVGKDGADKRIDVLAVAIRARMTATDLTELDLAYAPPYGSAKDPVNMAGYVIENVMEGKVIQLAWDQIDNLSEDDVLLDVRTRNEFERDTLPNAINVPLDELREHLDELDTTKRYLVFCQSGLRSYVACRILSQNGFDCRNMMGGYGFYQAIRLNKNAETSEVGGCGQRV